MDMAGAGKQNEVQVFNINGLPIEIMEKVYNYLPQKQIPPLCLVSKAWNEEIFNVYVYKTFVIDESQRPTNLDLDRSKRFKELTIRNLTSPASQFQANGETQQFLKWPSYVKKIIFENPVHPELISNIICSAQRLEWLEFNSSEQFDFSSLFNQESSLAMSKLKNLLILSFNHCPEPDEQAVVPMQGVGHNSVPVCLDFYFPKLAVLDLVGIPKTESMSILVKKCIAKHSQTLWRIIVNEHNPLYPGGTSVVELVPYTPPADALDPVEVASFGQIRNLKFLVVTTSWNEYWPIISQNQTKLEILNFTYFVKAANKNGSFGIPWTDIQPSISNSSSTLTEVILEDISQENCPFDFNIFEGCFQLRKLAIHCVFLSNNDILIQSANPLCSNGQSLPVSLEDLTLSITIDSAELLAIIQNCKKLSKLTLKWTGDSGILGVNSQVFLEMKNLPLLKEFSIEHFNTDAPGDLEMMDKISAVVMGHEFEGSNSIMEVHDNAHALLQNRLSFLGIV